MVTRRTLHAARPALIGFVGAMAVSAGAGAAWSATRDRTPERATAESPSSAQVKSPETATGYRGEIALRDFPVNSRGLTYGSDAAVADGEKGPDLVAVVGDHNVAGFSYAKDLDDTSVVTTPEEAVAHTRRLATEGPASIDVYDVEGLTVVDTFTDVVGETIDRPPAD
ncbi:hypothetical protein ABFU82_10870 [Nocardioides sp. WV_118_6]|uniref:hypothetical protein n=1 Tax=Nocardioides simplex TaxID=2045 RepID=UPI00214FAB9B|nr:hypothetical protein [Pimelobacter simplex]UUW89228.1 hypothetical protein M0M43_26365 [Pimelobacter simplex]UUW93056.1 hypothetical protein M0M48_15015 [Pimelobacter simplex]